MTEKPDRWDIVYPGIPFPNSTPTPQQQYNSPDVGTIDQVPSQQYQPTPTVTPVQGAPDNEYMPLIKEHFPDQDPMKWSNIMFKESSNRPNLAHINAGENSFSVPVENRDQWLQLRRQYPSIDAGLMQMNTAEAVSEYLQSQGLTYYDLITNPELNIKVASDLFYGRIPRTAPGIQNWSAAKGLGYTEE